MYYKVTDSMHRENYRDLYAFYYTGSGMSAMLKWEIIHTQHIQ